MKIEDHRVTNRVFPNKGPANVELIRQDSAGHIVRIESSGGAYVFVHAEITPAEEPLDEADEILADTDLLDRIAEGRRAIREGRIVKGDDLRRGL